MKKRPWVAHFFVRMNSLILSFVFVCNAIVRYLSSTQNPINVTLCCVITILFIMGVVNKDRLPSEPFFMSIYECLSNQMPIALSKENSFCYTVMESYLSNVGPHSSFHKNKLSRK